MCHSTDIITATIHAFRPLQGGIFFDRALGTTSRMFEFVMRMLAVGSNCLPARGIGEVALQMAGRLPPGSVVLNARVHKVCQWESAWGH